MTGAPMLPNFIVDLFVVHDLKGRHLGKDLRLVEGHQVVDDHVGDPQVLEQ
jgi:hypothetical protein